VSPINTLFKLNWTGTSKTKDVLTDFIGSVDRGIPVVAAYQGDGILNVPARKKEAGDDPRLKMDQQIRCYVFALPRDRRPLHLTQLRPLQVNVGQESSIVQNGGFNSSLA
jgi:hypothetical protein